MPYQGGWASEDDKDQQEQPRYNYVINVYQPFGLAFIAVFASQIPTVRFFPQSLNRSADITAAKASSNAAGLIEEQNNMQQKLIPIGRLLWTDGKVGFYVRYVCDEERYGKMQVPQIDEGFSTLGEDQFKCPQCGETSPVSMFAQGRLAVQRQCSSNLLALIAEPHSGKIISCRQLVSQCRSMARLKDSPKAKSA